MTLARDKNIAKTPGAISQQQIDQDEAALDEVPAAARSGLDESREQRRDALGENIFEVGVSGVFYRVA